MAVRRKDLVAPSNPILYKTAEPVSIDNISSSQTQEEIEKLLNLSYGEQKDRSKPILVGLAAPQAGISKRIILVDTGANGKGDISNLEVFINPEVISYSDETNEWYEGCYSTDRVCGMVSRPTSVTVKAYTRNGIQVEKQYSGYVARIFQHEIDHLNGKVFIDHVKDPENLHWVEDDEFPQYRDQEAWRNWPQKCNLQTWEEIKKGLTT